jgi:hypothetical protein
MTGLDLPVAEARRDRWSLSRLRARIGSLTATRVAMIGAVIVGIMLRAYQLAGQIVADDEWHALDAAMHMGYSQIASSFGPADYSIPLTLFYRLISQTVGLGEGGIRAPVFVAGVAALVALPLLARAFVGTATSVLFAWLLAVSPLHVYFSRYARPYSLTFLFATIAVAAFLLWQRSRARAWAVTYVVCAVLAVYLHLVVLPTVFAPVAFELAAAVLRKRSRELPSLARVAILGAVAAIGMAAVIGVPLVLDARSVAQKAAAGSIGLATLSGALDLLTGSGHRSVGMVMVLLAAVGLSSVWRRDRRLAGFGVFIVAVQIVAVFVMRPAVISHPIVFSRYCLSILPLLLLAAAAGVMALTARLRRRWLSWATCVGLVSVALCLGPLPKTYGYCPNNFTNHPIFQYTYDDSSLFSMTPSLRPLGIPLFYRWLSHFKPGSATVVEAPWHYIWGYNPLPFYQAVHRQPVVIGAVGTNSLGRARRGEPIPGTGIELARFVSVDDAVGLQKRGVRFVIFHKSLGTEFAMPGAPSVDPSFWIARYRQQYGAPIYDDPVLVVFEIKHPAAH